MILFFLILIANCYLTFYFVFVVNTMNFQEIMEIRSVYLLLPNTYPLTENVIFNYIINKKNFFILISQKEKEINCLFEILQLEIATKQ
jgi:hypothetical protein